MRRVVLLLTVGLALGWAAPAEASRFARFGVHDDAWLASGPGTLESRLDVLQRLGVDLVRYTVRWDEVAPAQPGMPRDHADAGYDWTLPDAVLGGLRARKIQALVTILGTPAWANGGQSPNWAPDNPATIADFAFAAATRYAWVREWLVWNEPNQRRWLRPTDPELYVQRILNPAYAAIKEANPRARVGGGVTAPRGNVGGVSPVAWIRAMGRAGAQLDAYAHHPYPTDPRRQTPWAGGCAHCETVTMASLGRLITEVRRAFGNKRIWLTEYGYQTNPPDFWLGIPLGLQARYVGDAAHRVYAAPFVDMLIHFMVRDDARLDGWQSGFFTASGTGKPAYRAYRFPLAQVRRRGTATVVWGQIRPRTGKQTYRLRIHTGRGWRWLGPAARTNARGVFTRTVRAPRGAKLQLWSPRDRAAGYPLVVR